MAKKERCERKDKHDPHEWVKGTVFRRECPGRKRAVKE